MLQLLQESLEYSLANHQTIVSNKIVQRIITLLCMMPFRKHLQKSIWLIQISQFVCQHMKAMNFISRLFLCSYLVQLVKGKKHALLDTGSRSTLIGEDFASVLKLHGNKTKIKMNSIKDQSIIKEKASLTMKLII